MHREQMIVYMQKHCKEADKHLIQLLQKNPRKNFVYWTDEENEKYKEALHQYGKDCIAISAFMGTRSINAVSRHKSVMIKIMKSNPNEENQRLIALLEARKYGSWTEEEKEGLTEALQIYGRDVDRIKSYLGGTRSRVAIKGRLYKYKDKILLHHSDLAPLFESYKKGSKE